MRCVLLSALACTALGISTSYAGGALYYQEGLGATQSGFLIDPETRLNARVEIAAVIPADLTACPDLFAYNELPSGTIQSFAIGGAISVNAAMVLGTGGGAGIVLSLPASAADNPVGHSLKVFKDDTGVGTVTVAPAGGETIAGAPTYNLATLGSGVRLTRISATTWGVS